MIKHIQNKPYLLLLLLWIFVFVVNLDVLIINIMEARNFITAREMIQDGHWVLTTLNGEPRYQKPPLPTWLTAVSALIFGLKNIFFLRLPAALSALVLLIYAYKFSIKISLNKRYAFNSVLILSTSFYIVFAGRNGQWDIFTHAFMMVSIYYLYLLLTSKNAVYKYSLLSGLFFGFSFMSKGPVSLYALWLPFLLSLSVVYKFNDLKNKVLPLSIFVITGALVSGWWHWYVYLYDAQAALKITQKEASNWSNYNVRPFYYYWSFFTQSGIWTIPAFIGLLYPYLKNRVFDKKMYRFTFLWTLISVVLLSLIPEKKSRYLLPVLIPLALNTGFYIDYLIRRFTILTDRKETVPVYFNFGLIAFIGIIFPLGGYLFLAEKISGIYWFWFGALSVSLFLIGINILKNLRKKNIKKVFFLTVAFIACVTTFGLPISKAIIHNPEYKSTALLHSWQQQTGLRVYNYSGFTPELIWAYGKPIASLSKNGSESIPDEREFGVLVSQEHLKRFLNTFSTKKGFNIKKITRYDMNPNAPGSRTHRPRLWKDLFVVTRLK